MPIDSKKIEQLLQYILSVSSSADGFDKELNRIQLIKYVYLVDLDYAYHNEGKTYSGIDWQFYHYGPWNTDLFKKIDPALISAGATKKVEPTIYKKDSIKYFFKKEQSLDNMGFKIDLRVQGSVQHYFRVFGNDTSRLLAFVYNTKPMLHASPNQNLDFKVCMKGETFVQTDVKAKELTIRQRKKLKQKTQKLRQKIRQKIELKKKRKSLLKAPEPRYDEVYLNGIAVIENDIDSSELNLLSGFSSVKEDVWDSEMRKASDDA